MLEEAIPVGDVIEEVSAAPTTSLAVFTPIQAGIAELRQRYAGAAFNLRTVQGNEDARRARKELVTLRSRADEAYKTWNEPILVQQKLAREMRDQIKAEVLALEQPIDEQIKADEARREAERAEKARIEAARVKAHRDRIAMIAGTPAEATVMTAAQIVDLMETVASIDISAATFEEFAEEAEGMRTVIQQRLAAIHAAKAQQEAEAARVAAEKAELARQRAELEAARAEAERVARERAAAERAAAAARAEEERRIAAERAELERQQAEAAAAQAAAEKALRDAELARELAEFAAPSPAPAPVEQVDAFAQEQAAAVTAAAAERAAAPAPVRERPTDDEIVIALAKAFKVTRLVAAEWLLLMDAPAAVARLSVTK